MSNFQGIWAAGGGVDEFCLSSSSNSKDCNKDWIWGICCDSWSRIAESWYAAGTGCTVRPRRWSGIKLHGYLFDLFFPLSMEDTRAIKCM
jgi:hypothetical protein